MAKLLIIGLDGADHEYISDRLSAGAMPVLGRLASEGSFGLLRSTVPPISCPAWPTMTTGFLPGNLGLFDLTVPDGYRRRIVSARDVAVPRLWDYIGACGEHSIVMNVPVTWPARPIHGVLVAGLLSPAGSPYTFPPEVGPDLEARFAYSPDHPASRRGKLRRLRVQTDAFLHLLDRHPWGVAMLVLSVTDWAQHDHWQDRAYRDRLFDEADAAVGHIIERAGAPNVAVISDHGFCGAGKILNVNRLLGDLGFLRYGGSGEQEMYVPNLVLKAHGARRGVLGRAIGKLVRPRKALALMHRLGMERALDLIPNVLWHGLKRHMVVWDAPIDWPATQAYLYNALPQTISLNVAGREPAGCVAPEDYGPVRAELAAALLQATDPTDGGPIFTRVTTREEAFAGRLVERAPDLLFSVRDDAYLVSPADHPSVVWGTHKLRGRHRSSGIYVLHGPAFRSGVSAEARLLDMTPTLLCAAGCAPPSGVDGRVAMDLLSVEAGRAAPCHYDLQIAEAAGGDADAASVEQRLRDLGYM
jgi:predicted AlkP superfamily phosphohydrolase/phosphomutase